jgi:hypothetical protein
MLTTKDRIETLAYLAAPCSRGDRPSMEYVGRILTVYAEAKKAPRKQRLADSLWYVGESNRILSALPNVDPFRAMLVASALSPRQDWNRVVALLAKLPTGTPEELRKLPKESLRSPGAVLTRAWDSAIGVLKAKNGPELMQAIGRGPKVRSFAYNLLGAAGARVVTIDSHAAAICGLGPEGLRGKRYGILAASYAHAAQLAGVKPHELQAATWCTWRAVPHKQREVRFFG